jgi:hypothetical protein
MHAASQWTVERMHAASGTDACAWGIGEAKDPRQDGSASWRSTAGGATHVTAGPSLERTGTRGPCLEGLGSAAEGRGCDE